jgi:hypothetical protein
MATSVSTAAEFGDYGSHVNFVHVASKKLSYGVDCYDSVMGHFTFCRRSHYWKHPGVLELFSHKQMILNLEMQLKLLFKRQDPSSFQSSGSHALNARLCK